MDSLETPTCERDLSDFSEQHSTPHCLLPSTTCPVIISKDTCDAVASEAPRDSTATAQKPACPAGAVDSRSDSSGHSGGGGGGGDVSMGHQMVCGGDSCAPARARWDAVNARMHEQMAIHFVGDASVDFVRGMIPHHEGAVDMCALLVEELECTDYEQIGALEGLVHFCNHVNREQKSEVAAMSSWLAERSLTVTMNCTSQPGHHALGKTATTKDDHHTHSDQLGAGRHSEQHMDMSMGCGNVSAPSSIQFIDANRQMHGGMKVDLSCAHTVDFVRMMIPHHSTSAPSVEPWPLRSLWPAAMLTRVAEGPAFESRPRQRGPSACAKSSSATPLAPMASSRASAQTSPGCSGPRWRGWRPGWRRGDTPCTRRVGLCTRAQVAPTRPPRSESAPRRVLRRLP